MPRSFETQTKQNKNLTKKKYSTGAAFVNRKDALTLPIPRLVFAAQRSPRVSNSSSRKEEGIPGAFEGARRVAAASYTREGAESF